MPVACVHVHVWCDVRWIFPPRVEFLSVFHCSHVVSVCSLSSVCCWCCLHTDCIYNSETLSFSKLCNNSSIDLKLSWAELSWADSFPMQADDVLEELREVCLQYPSHFQGIDIGGWLSSSFVAHVLQQNMLYETSSHGVQEQNSSNCDVSATSPRSSVLHFSKVDFINNLHDIFVVESMSSAHIGEISVHVEALWGALSNVPCRPPLTSIPITKIRFLANMLQSHFPRKGISEESEYVDARTRRLVKQVAPGMFDSSNTDTPPS